MSLLATQELYNAEEVKSAGELRQKVVLHCWRSEISEIAKYKEKVMDELLFWKESLTEGCTGKEQTWPESH